MSRGGHEWDGDSTVVWTPPEWALEGDSVAAPVSEPRQETFRETKRPDVEVEVRNVSGATALGSQRKVYELWTKNRVYLLDSQLLCLEVIDLKTGTVNPKHPFIGARLVGGQRREENANVISHPLPEPGSDAVFQKSDPTTKRIRLSVTSKVARVILHCQRIRVSVEEKDKTWGKITGY